tara:strand:+ start:906 stop:1130 length:225 start_codon:yes stop_codon:yes gene_type:complete
LAIPSKQLGKTVPRHRQLVHHRGTGCDRTIPLFDLANDAYHKAVSLRRWLARDARYLGRLFEASNFQKRDLLTF